MGSNSDNTPPSRLLAIVGPTATGKSDLALAVARRIQAEIISADSMQIYRHMDIGTAKPPKEVRDEIAHHFIDIIDPDQPFSAGEFARQAHHLIREKTRMGQPLIVVGGTGLYIKALEKGLVRLPPIPPDIQKRLWESYVNEGLPALYEKLQKADPATASAIHPHDRFRILRALGILETTGTGISKYRAQHGFKETPIPLIKIGLAFSRDTLYERIDKRVHRMIDNGWLEEVKSLLEMGYDETLKPMQAIGYKQLTRVIRGTEKLSEAIETIKKETRHLAKRQITWFKKESPHTWLSMEGKSLDQAVESLLTFLREEAKKMINGKPENTQLLAEP